MPTKEQIAHDLAIVYIINRYGAEVTGDFSVDDGEGSGRVDTERLPGVDQIRRVRVGTGERRVFGLLEKKVLVEDGYEVDSVFRQMISDYTSAYHRFLALLDE